MADIFSDESLFSEFERDRDTQNIFIQYDQDESGAENRSRIVFRGTDSDWEDSEDEEENADQKEVATDQPASTEQEAKPSEKEESETSNEGEQNGATQSTAYQEQHEKTKLRQFTRLIDSTRCVSDEQSPAVQIIFQNNKFAKKYRSRIEQFIVSLAQHADKKDFTRTATDLGTKATTVSTCVDLNDKLPTEKRNNRMWQAHGIIGCAQFHNGFMVDIRGWPLDEDDMKDYNSIDVKYLQIFDEIFPPDEPTQTSSKPSKPKDQCFNCGGDHRLSECVAPRDHNRIRTKRRERQENSSKSSNPGRYHEDPELDPNRANFVAGRISENLRVAMGLNSDQIPSYIYRMRLYGYPPGWLLEANRKASSLAMYDKDGRETNLRGESLEDGECAEQSVNFDLNKIIEYPGFTVTTPLGFIDESEAMGMPPIQTHQLKKTLMEEMLNKELAKKRKMEEEKEESRKKLKTGPEDMDVTADDKKSPIPQSTSTPTEKEEKDGEKKEGEEKEGEEKEAEEKEGENKEGEEKNSRDGEGSPGAANMQQEYKKMVQELDDVGDSTATNGDTSQTTPTRTSSETESSDKSDLQLLREKNFSFSSCSSISRDFGTPILVRERSIKAVPSAEKFSVGVEEHIPFENLPDSVGTFEKMKNLFSLIRNKIKKPKK